MFAALSKEGINIQMISTSEIAVSCVIETSTRSWPSAPCTTRSSLAASLEGPRVLTARPSGGAACDSRLAR